jgi:hypothetical protein
MEYAVGMEPWFEPDQSRRSEKGWLQMGRHSRGSRLADLFTLRSW